MKNLTLFLLLCLCPVAAGAVDCTSFASTINAPLNENVVKYFVQIAEDTVERTLKKVQKEEPEKYKKSPIKLEDFKRPLLPLADSFLVLDYATLGAFREFCKIGDSADKIFGDFRTKHSPKHWSLIQDMHIMIMYIHLKMLMEKKLAQDTAGCRPHLKTLIENYIKECKP